MKIVSAPYIVVSVFMKSYLDIVSDSRSRAENVSTFSSRNDLHDKSKPNITYK